MNTSKSGGSCIRSTDCVNIFILVFILCYRDFHASTAGDTRRAGLPRRLTVPWTRPQDEVRRGPDAGFPRAGAEAPLPRCGLRQKMGEGGLRGNGEERVTEELGGGEASSVSGSPFTLARDELFPFRTGGATLTCLTPSLQHPPTSCFQILLSVVRVSASSGLVHEQEDT